MPNTQSRSETAEKISVLLRIYRAAVKSGDDALRRATAKQLKEYGIDAADLMAAPESKGGK